MNESVKTSIFVVVAAVLAAVAFITQPRAPQENVKLKSGEILFPEFKDPLAATSLEIVQFDDASGETRTFKVAKGRNGLWVLPSHSDYPADAEEQLKDAANILIGVQSLAAVTELPNEHALFGVVDPQKMKTGDQGAGALVRFKDEKGANLAELIIGAQDKKSIDQRFVRIPTQDLVHVVKLNFNKLPTTFDKWIEKDLLKLDGFSVDGVRLKDYSIVRTNRGAELDMRMEADLKLENGKWDLVELASFNRRQKVLSQLSDEEELSTEKLNALKEAIDQLQIVNVQRKPKGLSADLMADDNLDKNEEAILSLQQRGFFLAGGGAGTANELFAKNGEVHVSLKDGVEYILRFGDIAGAEEGAADTKLNRYLFVTTRFDDAHFPPPLLEPEPQEPAPAPTDKKPADGTNGGAESDDEAKGTDEPKTTDGEKPADKPEEKKVDLDTIRERIKKENERKQNEWRDKKNKGLAKVAELNARFADWYYVISEETYKKIHVGRADIIQERKDGGLGVDAFRKLQTEGLNKKEAAPPPMGAGRPPFGQ